MDEALEQNNKALVAIIQQTIPTCKMLRQKMLDYCDVPDKSHLFNVLMDLIRRTECNLYSSAILARESLKMGSSTYYKLPLGLLVRNCTIDCILALYLSSIPEAEAEEEIAIMNKDYVKALYDQKPVYIDRLKNSGIDPGLATWYESLIEDNFNRYLKINIDENAFSFSPLSNKEIRKASAISGSLTIDKQFKYLKEHSDVSELSEQVYGYYKYLSQYQHFSENSYGDMLAPYFQDNVSFPGAIKSINRSVDYILNKVFGEN